MDVQGKKGWNEPDKHRTDLDGSALTCFHQWLWSFYFHYSLLRSLGWQELQYSQLVTSLALWWVSGPFLSTSPAPGKKTPESESLKDPICETQQKTLLSTHWPRTFPQLIEYYEGRITPADVLNVTSKSPHKWHQVADFWQHFRYLKNCRENLHNSNLKVTWQ